MSDCLFRVWVLGWVGWRRMGLPSTTPSETPDQKPKKGSVVTMKYKGFLPNGHVFDENQEGFAQRPG